MRLRFVFWDFGNTLVDQDWMLRAPEAYPDWPQAWTEAARGEDQEAWSRNELTCEDIVRRVSGRLGMPLASTLDHIRHCCSNVRFFDAVLRVARDCSLRLADGVLPEGVRGKV